MTTANDQGGRMGPRGPEQLEVAHRRRFRRPTLLYLGALVIVSMATSSAWAALRGGPNLRPEDVCDAGDVDVQVTQGAPLSGEVGVRHFGALVEVGVQRLSDCQPTLYVLFDGEPYRFAEAPPGSMPANEFENETHAVAAGDGCVVADRLWGNLMYSGEHRVDVQWGCIPGGSHERAGERTIWIGESQGW